MKMTMAQMVFSQRVIPVVDAATALKLANMIAYEQEAWENYDEPTSVYVYEVEPMKNRVDLYLPGWDNCCYCLAAFIECDKYLKR